MFFNLKKDKENELFKERNYDSRVEIYFIVYYLYTLWLFYCIYGWIKIYLSWSIFTFTWRMADFIWKRWVIWYIVFSFFCCLYQLKTKMVKSQLVNRLVTVAWVLFITWRFYISESMPFDAFLIWVSFPFFFLHC